MKPILKLVGQLLSLLCLFNISTAQNSAWKIIKPTNTGITGEMVRFAKFDPSYNLWVSARWPFWQEGGIAKFNGNYWTPYSTVDSWMPTEFVHSVDFQTNGVAWIGTDSGLIRFDGTTVQVYNMNNTPFPSNHITDVHVDGLGNVWCLSKSITTIDHGVMKFDGTNWTVFNSSNSGIPYFDITCIDIDPNNNLWVATWAMGMVKYNGTTWTTYDSNNGAYSGGGVTGFAFPSNGSVWVSAHTGIYKLTNTVFENIPAPPQAYSTVAVHPDQTLWFGSYGGSLLKYDGTNFTSYSYGNHLYSIDFDSVGDVWAGGLAGVKKYVNGVNTITYNVYNTSLTSYFVDGIDFDANGNAWFATAMGGVCKFDLVNWHGFNPNNFGSQPWTFANNSAADIFVDQQDGKVWVGSNGVGYWNGTNWTIFTLANSAIPDNEVIAIAKDLSGKIWIGTVGYGAAYYNGTSWTKLDFGGNYMSNTIKDIAIHPDGSIWFASDYGLHKTIDGVNYTTYMTNNSGLPGNYINAIAFEANGTMWVGTDQGLAKYSGGTWTIYNESNSGVPANLISDIEISPTGQIWVSAFNTQTWPYYGGIAMLNGNSWTTYMYGNSPLTHYQVEKLKFDPAGKLWISPYSQGLMTFLPPLAILPVELSSFTGKKVGNAVELNWQTATELNTSKFIIERGKGVDAFSSIGSVPAVGNSQQLNNYSFTDNSPMKGINFYRLKTLDLDGKLSYSKLVKINFDLPANRLSIYPNPASNFIVIDYPGTNQQVAVKIYDFVGKLVKSETSASASLIRIPISNLSAGTYVIELNDGCVYRKMFIKN